MTNKSARRLVITLAFLCFKGAEGGAPVNPSAMQEPEGLGAPAA